MSGSSCATTGCRTVYSNPIPISSITAASHGTTSPISHGASCHSVCAIGRTGLHHRVLVLAMTLKKALTEITRVILSEAERNPEFAARLSNALALPTGASPASARRQPREAQLSHIHPADRDRVRAAFAATRSVGGSYEIDFRIMLAEDVRWISAR